MDKYQAPQEYLKRLAQAKKQMRKELAKLSYEQKVAKVQSLQQLAAQIRPIREQLREQLKTERQKGSL